MKTHLIILGFLFMLSAAHAQTQVSQGKQDAPTPNGSGVVSLQGPASPLGEDSKSAPKQVVAVAPQAQSQTQPQTVTLTGTAQPWDPNAKPAEKKIIVTGVEPANRESKQESDGAMDLKEIP